MGLYTRMGVSEYTVGLYTRGLYWGGGGGGGGGGLKFQSKEIQRNHNREGVGVCDTKSC
jgi:hypothetical protein